MNHDTNTRVLDNENWSMMKHNKNNVIYLLSNRFLS